MGPAGRSRTVTEGVVGAMRALEVVVFLNNSSMEEVMRSDALARERDGSAKKMVDHEAEVAALKVGAPDADKMIAFLEEKAESVVSLLP